jgi:hypothetical protein
MSNQIAISNEGGEIIATNYWQSEYAAAGKFFLSLNAGVVRLLVPPSQMPMVHEMRTAKTIVLTLGEYEGKSGAVELLFDDHSDTPFVLFLDPAQIDRRWPTADDGREVGFVVYVGEHMLGRGLGDPSGETKGPGIASTCHLRRTRKLPYLKPLK